MSQQTDGPNKTFLVDGSVAIPQYSRVKLSGGYLVAAGAEDSDLGTLNEAVFADGLVKHVSVRLKNVAGTCKMIAAGAAAQHANAYGAASGRVDDVANENFIGLYLDAPGGAGSIVEVLRQVGSDKLDNLGAIDGNIVIDDDFLGDWPAAASALSGQGPYAWTKTETNALGVISSDQPNGVLKFSADAVAEAATCALYMANSPVDIDKQPIFEAIVAVYDIGDDAAVDIDFGLASDTHATDFEAIAAFAAFHLDGNDLSLKCHSDDNVVDTAAVDTTVDLVDDTFYAFKIDCTDKSDVKFYYRPLTSSDWIRVASATTFDISNYTGALTPIVMVEKTNNDSTFDVRVDRVRVQAQRN